MEKDVDDCILHLRYNLRGKRIFRTKCCGEVLMNVMNATLDEYFSVWENKTYLPTIEHSVNSAQSNDCEHLCKLEQPQQLHGTDIIARIPGWSHNVHRK